MAVREFNLPVSIATRTDVGRLQQELEAIDSFLTQAAIRQPGTTMKLPKTSRLFDEVTSVNGFSTLQEKDRQELKQTLSEIHDHAPILHISFQSDPSALFLQKLCTWLRQNIHPTILVQIGLRPTIGAGCVIRTDNKYFDFSLRQQFNDKKDLLTRYLQVKTETPASSNSAELSTP